MKKLFAILTAAAMLFTVLCGCASQQTTEQGSTQSESQDTQTSGEKTKFVVWLYKTFDDNSNQMAVERAEAFGELNNLDMEIELVAQKDWFSKWSAAIEAKTTPDVSYFPYNSIPTYYEMGALEPVDDVIETVEGIQGDYFEGALSAVKYGDHYYGVPLNVQPHVMFYRTDKLEAAGFSEPPATWEEYVEVAKAITNESEGFYGSGIGIAANNSDTEWLMRTILWGYGAAETEEDGKTVTINSPETAEALNIIKELFDSKATPESAKNWDDSGNNTAYLAGQVGMVVNVGTLITTLQNDMPDLAEVTGVCPVPGGPKGTFSTGALGTYGIFKNTQNLELAKEFIAFQFETEWYDSWIEATAPFFVPPFTRSADMEIWQSPTNALFYEAATNFGSLGRPASLSSGLANLFNNRTINQALMKIVVDGDSVEDAMQFLEDAYNQELNP